MIFLVKEHCLVSSSFSISCQERLVSGCLVKDFGPSRAAKSTRQHVKQYAPDALRPLR